MSIRASHSEESDELTIKVVGNFTYKNQIEFKDVYHNHKEIPKKYIIDLQEVDYIDSTALGMLLLLREYAHAQKDQIKIISKNQNVYDLLRIARFSEIFEIVKKSE